jgi:hypothetical protein
LLSFPNGFSTTIRLPQHLDTFFSFFQFFFNFFKFLILFFFCQRKKNCKGKILNFQEYSVCPNEIFKVN